jgi:hypothetical protein
MEKRGDYGLGVPGKIKSGHEQSPTFLNNLEIEEREGEYLKVLDKLKPEYQELMRDFGSTLLEQDRYNQYKNNPNKRRALQRQLVSLGLNSRGVRVVMRYFNLPIIKDIK